MWPDVPNFHQSTVGAFFEWSDKNQQDTLSGILLKVRKSTAGRMVKSRVNTQAGLGTPFFI